MSDAAHNRTIDGTRSGIQQRVKLECEREQQEQLLLSVIPAYIAAEVCALVRFRIERVIHSEKYGRKIKHENVQRVEWRKIQIDFHFLTFFLL